MSEVTDLASFERFLAGRFTPGQDTFRVEDLTDHLSASPQRLAAWLRALAADGVVTYLPNEREFHGTRYGARAGYYPVKPYYEYRGRRS